MNTIFSSPFGLVAFSAIPVLLAIYLLRNRFRTHHISSLMLWEDQKKARQGGLYINRIKTSLLFFLELLTIILLILAAAGPMIRSDKDTRVLVIVLDDSFSMLAGDNETPRSRAIDKVKKLLQESGDFHVRFIRAGNTVQLLGGPAKTISQVLSILEGWECLSPNADLDQATTLGYGLAGKTARMLVITDHKPQSTPAHGRLEWWAFGEPLTNLAFVNASRTSSDTKDRCLLALANFSSQPAKTVLLVESLDSSETLMRRSIDLSPNQTRRIIFELKGLAHPIRACIEDDNMHIDNQIIMLPESEKPLRLGVDIKNELLDSLLQGAVQSANLGRLTSVKPQLLITDRPVHTPGRTELWTVRIISDSNASAYLGPFVLDRSHPLTQGLSLNGVIWAAGKASQFTGNPVIAAGNVPLLADRKSPTGSHDITVYLNPELSTLPQSPNWPILFWNLLEWRKSNLPGLSESNLTLGSEAVFLPDLTEKELTVIDPAGKSSQIYPMTETILIEAPIPGLYELKTEKGQYRFTVNAISKTESDLTKATTGKWGKWQQAGLYWWEYRPLDWLLLLIALTTLTIHRLITANQQKGSNP